MKSTPFVSSIAIGLMFASCCNNSYDVNRAAVRKIGDGIDTTIVVMGHKNQDPDAVCSAISFASLMQQLGVKATPCLQEKPTRAVKYILDYCKYEYPEVKKSIKEGDPIALTDHNAPQHSVEGLKSANLRAVVDHHNIACNTEGPIFYKTMIVGSANTTVYSLYKECGIKPTQQIARIMLAGIIADTDSLSLVTSTGADSMAISELNKIARIKDLGELTRNIRKANESYEGMTDEEIFTSDFKTYECNKTKYAIGCINASEATPLEEMCKRMLAVVDNIKTEKGVDMVFAMIEQKIDGEFKTHFLFYGNGSKEVAEKAFGVKAQEENCILLDRRLSRKKDVVPPLEKIFSTRN